MEGGRALTLADKTSLTKYWIKITADKNQFKIEDNCGGITLDDAADYAFTFGRTVDDEPDNYSIGVYGIGMKRAVFKLGSSIKIHSTYRAKHRIESFAVPIDVPTWLKDDKSAHWDFDIEPAKSLEEPGVEITVGALNDGAVTSFGDPAFINRLKRVLARDYALHLHRGISIHVNGDKILGWTIEFRDGGQFSPMRLRYEEKLDAGKVKIEVLAGMAAPPPESSEPREDEEGESRFGWYVICNGRIVLAADKTSVAGWGLDGWPQWHPQYNGFMGIILFTSENASLLPLTTTKRSVDVSSPIYHRARPRMREASKQWIAYTNARKLSVEDARRKEELAKPRSIFSIRIREQVALPKLAAVPQVKMANIGYSMPLERVRSLADELGNINMSYRDVGLRSFEYAYDDLVGEE